jgi:hypothetical protein
LAPRAGLVPRTTSRRRDVRSLSQAEVANFTT